MGLLCLHEGEPASWRVFVAVDHLIPNYFIKTLLVSQTEKPSYMLIAYSSSDNYYCCSSILISTTFNKIKTMYIGILCNTYPVPLGVQRAINDHRRETCAL